jgi:hypothetical protein
MTAEHHRSQLADSPSEESGPYFNEDHEPMIISFVCLMQGSKYKFSLFITKLDTINSISNVDTVPFGSDTKRVLEGSRVCQKGGG